MRSHLSPWPIEPVHWVSDVHCSAVVSGVCVRQNPMTVSSDASPGVPLSCSRIGTQVMPATQSLRPITDCRHTAEQRATELLLLTARARRSQQLPLAQSPLLMHGAPSSRLKPTSVQCSC